MCKMKDMRFYSLPVLSLVLIINLNMENALCATFSRESIREHRKGDDIIRGVHIGAPHVMKKRSTDKPMRIGVYYDDSVYRLTLQEYLLLTDKLVPKAVKFWEDVLTVRNSVRPIRLNRRCPTSEVFKKDGRTYCVDNCKPVTACGYVPVPENHLNPCHVCNSTGGDCRTLNSTHEDEDEEFDDVDFMLYVSAEDVDKCQTGNIADAVHCQQEAELDRPIAGHTNICPGKLADAKSNDALLESIKHEILHALGFGTMLYAFYRDDNGEPLTERLADGNPPFDETLRVHKWSERVVKEITRKNWVVRGGTVERTFQMVVTPRVVKEVRDHFNCSELEGAELEDQGRNGTPLAHWEMRVFLSEAMTGTHTQNSVFSRVTFALMEDTGWYRADYRLAAPLDWGRGLGCDFVMASCKQWLDTKKKNPAPFCNTMMSQSRLVCSEDRQVVVACNLGQYDTDIPKMYQHFDQLPHVAAGEEAQYGGPVTLADYCPYLQEVIRTRTHRGGKCSRVYNEPKSLRNFALEEYGEDSKCFNHYDRPWRQKNCTQERMWQEWGSGCYKYKCRSGRLNIMVRNYTYPCYYTGQELEVQIVREGWLHIGIIVCPPCTELCGEEFASRNETCSPNKKSVPTNLYPKDKLVCGNTSTKATTANGVTMATPAMASDVTIATPQVAMTTTAMPSLGVALTPVVNLISAVLSVIVIWI